MRPCAARQGLGQFGYDNSQTGTEEADGNAGSKVPTAADEDEGRHGDIKPQIWNEVVWIAAIPIGM